MKEVLLAVTHILVFRFVVCQPCTRTQSLNVTDGELHVNGSLTHNGVLYNSGSWYEVQEDGGSTRYGCPCIDRVCLWKCCSANAAFHNRTCNESSLDAVNPFSPEVYKGKEVTSVVAHQHFFYVYGRPCNESYLVDSASSSEELHLQENGTLYEVASGHNQWHASGGYCLDMMVTNVSQGPRLVASVCFPEESVTDDSYLLYTAYAIGLILSAPFLLATFLVYALVPELRNLHGLCLMAYCAGLIVAFPFLAYLKLHIGRIGVAMTGCLTVAFIVYYAFQTSFFWLNIMCFDIWRTFSNSYRGGGMTKKRERKRFAMYAVYAWGMPLVLTAVTMAMQFSDLPSDVITPGFGTRRCWFVDWLSSVLYFYTPVLILVVCNVVLFSVTANRIRTIRQETAILKGSESSRSDKLKKDKQRYGLYLKLFLVMGVNWTLELVSLALGGSNWYWIVTDISNVGLGVFVFFIFVWKKRVRKLVQKRCRTIFGSPDTEPDSQPKWTSSSAPTEDTRISSTDESAIRLKDLH